MLRRESGGLDTASLGEAVLSLLLGMPELRPSELTWVVKLAGEVRATLGGVSPAETVRRLCASIMQYNGADLSDDATLFLIEYHGDPEPRTHDRGPMIEDP